MEANVGKSGYYYCLKHRHDRAERDRFAYGIIEKIFSDGKRKVGVRQIAMIARRKYGVVLNPKRIYRIKREYNLITQTRRKRACLRIIRSMESRKYANELNMEFKTDKPDRKYSTDISYLPYRNGCAFLSATKDLATREIVAYSRSDNLGLEQG